MREIVAAKIGSIILNDLSLVKSYIEQGRTDIEWLDRQHMEFMAKMDLGQRWTYLATGPIWFLIDDGGKPHQKHD